MYDAIFDLIFCSFYFILAFNKYLLFYLRCCLAIKFIFRRDLDPQFQKSKKKDAENMLLSGAPEGQKTGF